MNSVLENIRNRRSVRFYEDKQIPQDIMSELLEAANMAPSGANSQPWRFVVVQDPAVRAKLAGLALPRYRQWIANAPAFMQEMRREIDRQTSDPVYYSAPAIVFTIGSGMTADTDCPMACDTLMLAARSYGIGSCWTFFGQLVLEDPETRSLLELQEGEKVYGPIVLGYPAGDFPSAPVKKPVQVKWL